MEWAVALASYGLLQTPTLGIQSVSLKHYRLSPFKLFIIAFGCVSEGDSAELQRSQVAELLPGLGLSHSLPRSSSNPSPAVGRDWEYKPTFPS